MIQSRSSWCVCLSLALAGCGGHEAKLGANKMGDLNYALPSRERPDLERVASCGDGQLNEQGSSVLRRTPYLQKVTDRSAWLMFSADSARMVTVDITLPGGRAIGSFDGVTDPSASLAAGTLQRVVALSGLEADTLYCYALRGLMNPTGFRTAPEATSSKPIRFIAFGDSGDGGGNQEAVRRQMLTVPFDFVLHVGDIAYDHGTLGQLEREFFQVYSGIDRAFPVFPISGNHDYDTSAAAPFRQAFGLFENGQPAGVERWYSFDWGNIHFTALDTQRIDQDQADWLEADLAATQKPWKIVFAHQPPYSSGEHGCNQAFRNLFGPAIERHRVALVLNGHDHDYERTKPIAGTTYVVTGGGGHGTRPVGSSSFTEFSVETLHFVQVEVHDTELFLRAVDGTGVEFDTARIPLPE